MKNFLAAGNTGVNIGEEFLLQPNKSIGQSPLFSTLGSFISTLLKNIYALAGVLLFILLIFGGVSIILGAGGNDPKKASQGSKAITWALIGFLIVFASYWIVQIISFITGIKILNTNL